MIAFFLMMLLTLVYQSFLNASSSLFHTQNSLLLVQPLLLVIAVFCLSMTRALWILMFCGILMDSLTTGSIGTHMLLMVFLGFVGMLLSSSLGKPHWPLVFAFLMGASLLYRILLSYFVNFGIFNLLFGPVLDACVGMMIFYWMPRRVIKMD